MNADYFGPVARPDEETKQAVRMRHGQLTKLAGSPDWLEKLGIWISTCQGRRPPRNLDNCCVYAFAGDHGVAQGRASAYLSEVSAQILTNIEAKGTDVNAITDIAGAIITGVDISLDHDAKEPYRIRRSCGPIDRRDTIGGEEVDKTTRTDIATVDTATDEGVDLLITGNLGTGSTTPAAAPIRSTTNPELVVIVGRGIGIDDEGWGLRVVAVCDAMFHVRRLRNDSVEVLCRISSPDMITMAVFSAQVAVRHTPVILDGVVVTSAVLLADQLAPDAHDQWAAGHKPAEPVYALAFRHLDKGPLLEYGMYPGEGSGTVAVLPLIKFGVSVLRNMAVSADVGVSTKD